MGAGTEHSKEGAWVPCGQAVPETSHCRHQRGSFKQKSVQAGVVHEAFRIPSGLQRCRLESGAHRLAAPGPAWPTHRFRGAAFLFCLFVFNKDSCQFNQEISRKYSDFLLPFKHKIKPVPVIYTAV